MINPFTWICDLFRAGNKPEPTIITPQGSLTGKTGQMVVDDLAADAVTAQQDAKAKEAGDGGTLVANHFETAMKGNTMSYLDRSAQAARLDFLAGVASDPYPSAKKKPHKRQPIKARKALKAVKAKKKAKRK